jgi:2-polyprenyl-3-methyl-5-hydroxy-6-metoxy-1,4-benzoquinol methylase/tetratricopeptide (TPR) repeat protein
MKLALCIIAKDEQEQLIRIVNNYGQHFDEIHIAYDDEKAVFDHKKTKVNWHKYEWRNDFAHKRNWLRDKLSKDIDYYFRLDCDDKIINPNSIRRVAEKAKINNVSIVSCYYDYSRDEWGNTNAAHYRETIIKNTDNLYWNKKIHENILPKSKVDFSIVIDDEVKIFHDVGPDHADKSALRNIEFLTREYEEDKANCDPRTLAYLGRTFLGFGKLEPAEFFLSKHIEKSGWDEDRYMSYIYLCDLYIMQEKYREALSCALEALQERVDYPNAYFKMHEIYMGKKQWKKAIEWGEMGFTKKAPDTFMILDPSSTTWRPALSMAYCYFQDGKFEEAKKLFDLVERDVPGHEFVEKNKKLFNNAALHRKYMKYFTWMLRFLKDADQEKVGHLLKSVPNELRENEVIIRLNHQFEEPKVWPDKSIAIFCSKTLHEWTPESIKDGIGGSEEAIIYLSKELTKLGYQITVFNNCGEKSGNYDGVEYKNFYEFNSRDFYDVVISWRANIFEYGLVKAKKRIVWMHDVPDPDHYKNPDNLEAILALSEFHKTLLPEEIPDEKVYISANGINVEDFKNKGIKREPHRVIYASSYDRGLVHLLDMWPDVRKEVPDAELHIFYGWHNFDNLVADGLVDGRFKEEIVKKMDQPGVFEHGKIGHKELIDEFYKSSIWAYPCHFNEISCITAMKAQQTGCMPLTTDYAALKETVKTGTGAVIVRGNPNESQETRNSFKEQLIIHLKSGTDFYKKPDYDFSWEAIAKDWDKNLLDTSKIGYQYKDLDDYIKTYKERPEDELSPLANDLEIDRFTWALDKAKELEAKTLLDIGTNDGLVPIRASEKHGIVSAGIDISDINLAIGKKYIEDKKLKDVLLEVGCYERMGFRRKFDCITLFEILEHVLDLDVFFDTVKTNLNSGGHILISVPDEFGAFGRGNPDPQHIRLFNKDSLKEAIPDWLKIKELFVKDSWVYAVCEDNR